MFDFNTLFVVTMFISAVAGLLLLLAWRQNPTISALGLWGSAFLMSAVSMMLLIQGGTTPNLAGLSLGTMLWITAYGVMWTAARSFEGRHTPLLATLAGALLFLVVCQFDSFANSLSARMMFSSAAVGVYLLMSASEIWRGNDRELVSRWPAIVVLVVHGGMFLGRVPLIDALPYPAGALPADTSLVSGRSVRTAVLHVLHAAPAGEHGQGAGRAAAAPAFAARSADRGRQSPCLLRAWRQAPAPHRRRGPWVGAAAVRSRPVQEHQ